MPVEERRRVALHNQVSAAWGEEAAQTLFDLITPAGHELATRHDVDELRRDMQGGFAAVDARFSLLEERLDARFAALDARLDARFGGMDERFAGMDERFAERMESMEHRLTGAFEHRIADAVTTQTRTLVFSQLAALVTIAALAFGLR